MNNVTENKTESRTMSLSLEHSRHCLKVVQAARTKPDAPQDKTVCQVYKIPAVLHRITGQRNTSKPERNCSNSFVEERRKKKYV